MEAEQFDRSKQAEEVAEPKPWGLWATIGFSAIIAAVCFVCGFIFTIGFVILAKVLAPDLDLGEFVESLGSNGLFVASLECILTPLAVGLILLFARLRKGITVKDYLGLHKPLWKPLSLWLLVMVLYAAVYDAGTYITDRPVPEFMLYTYNSISFKPLLWFAVIIAAPIVEELFFRGFLLKGIEHSRVGPFGAVMVTALLWAGIHTQYDLFVVFGTFGLGVLLGLASIKTKSVYVPIAMHMVWNLLATVELVIAIELGYGG